MKLVKGTKKVSETHSVLLLVRSFFCLFMLLAKG